MENYNPKQQFESVRNNNYSKHSTPEEQFGCEICGWEVGGSI